MAIGDRVLICRLSLKIPLPPLNYHSVTTQIYSPNNDICEISATDVSTSILRAKTEQPRKQLLLYQQQQ